MFGRFALPCMGLVLAACAQAQSGEADYSGAFEAAGFHREGDIWKKCDDPGTMTYSPGAIQDVGDLNGDGAPEFIVTEGGSYCYGNTGTAFVLLTKAGDKWQLVTEAVGIPVFLDRKGADGWPDIEIGGPGFCFPLMRREGSEYRQVGSSYEGKAC